jgi:hypothetical protein
VAISISEVSATISGIAAIVACSVYLGRRMMRIVRSIDRIVALPSRYDTLEKVLAANSEAVRDLTHTVEVLSAMVSGRTAP